ncbi:YncE family protein [Pontibacter harenae]|uniref:YncE family protein n=1 Tax=Pontibacter harenae TaxID=2894083 RepID=UPI001E3A110A|nr:YncE family protein [Pontibacter harenae]MCC9165827.1 YncE family protein [Pontibacter harenae]
MRKFNYFRSLFLAVTLITSSLAFTSCDNDNDGPSGAYAEDGVFMVNEGSFGTPNGSISYYNNRSQQVQNTIFQNENDRLLGDVIQNMVIHGDRAFIVANNSNKIEVVNANTFNSLGTIEGLEMPRYFAALNEDKGYVTEIVSYNGSPGRVSVIDLNTFTVSKTIEVGVQPQQLVIAGGKVYVANSGGNTITVINSSTDAVESTITVTEGPNSLVIDRNNALWVASSGVKVGWPVSEEESSPGALSKINLASNTVTSTLTFNQNAPSPSKLTTNGNRDKLYYVFNRKVYQQDVNATTLNTMPLIDRGTYIEYGFYGLGVDPETGYIYEGKVNDFTSSSWVIRYSPTGAPVDSFRVGIAPNGFVFK